VLQVKMRQNDSRFPLRILFVLMAVGVFWASVSSAGADEYGFEGTSIRVYVKWEGFWGVGPHRAFRWGAEGLEEIKDSSRPDDYRSRTNVARPWGDKPSFGLPQNLFPQDTRLDVPFAVSRDGRMLVSAVHRGGANTLSLSREFAVVDLTAKRLVHLAKAHYNLRSVTWSPTGRYFALFLKENVTKQLWKGPLDLFAGLVGHPRSYYTLYTVIYTLDGKATCKRTIAEKLLFGSGYIDWESGGSLRWQASDIVGYRLVLIDKGDKQVYRSFAFTAQGDAIAGVGVGARTATEWKKWEIDDEGILNIIDGERILYKMRKLYERNGRVGVEYSGKNHEYVKQKYP